MKKILILAAIAALWSCNDDKSCNPPKSNRIDISAAIAGITVNPAIDSRTVITGSTAAWTDGDALGLFCPEATTPGVNVQYTVANTSGTPSWSTSTPLYWANGTTVHKFLAYAPYASGNTSATAVKVPAINTQTGTIAPAQDLLISNNLNTSGIARDTPVELTFTHAFALIELKILLGGGIAANTTLVSFTIAGGAAEKLYTSDNTSTINLSSGAFTLGAGTNTAAITPATPPVLTTTTTSYYALVVPGSYTAPSLTLNIKEGGTTSMTTATVPVGTNAFDAAKKYTYTVTVSRTAITISTATITDWVTVNGSPINPGI